MVAACGGSSTSTSDPYDVWDGSTGGTATVAVLSLDTSGPNIQKTSGTYTYADAQVAVASSDVDIDASSVLSLKRGDSERYSYVAGISDNSVDYRLIAVQTDSSNLPSDTTIEYLGQAIVRVTTSGGTFVGTMDSTVTANFGSTGPNVNILLSGYDGDDQTGDELIEFRNLSISGAGYEESDLSTAVIENFGVLTAVNTDGAILDVIGVFAGDNGTETAGVGTIEAVGTEEALVQFSGTSD